MTTTDDPASPRPRRVLIADDTEDIRLLLRVAMGARPDVELVGQAADGREAIELTAALRPDLLVLDVEMPVLDGISALPELRAASPDTRIVMLSAMTAPDFRERAAAAGAVAYIEKTTSIRVLVDELLRAADLLDVVIGSLAPVSTLAVPRETGGPAQARRFVADALQSWGQGSLTDTIELLVSELVTNVIVHTGARPDVSVRLLSDRVHVEVVDGDPTLPTPRDAELDATSGRGLALLDALSLGWGATAAGTGKIVWFDVSRD